MPRFRGFSKQAQEVAEFVPRLWHDLSHRARQGPAIRYLALAPESIGRRELSFPTAVAKELSRAESAMARLQNRWAEPTGPALAQLLLRMEATASVQLAGTSTSYTNAAWSWAGRRMKDDSGLLVLAVQQALAEAIEMGQAVSWAELASFATLAQIIRPGDRQSSVLGDFRGLPIWTGFPIHPMVR